MDGREGMVGSAASYYFNRGGVGVSGSGPGPGPGTAGGSGGGAPPGPHSFKHLQNTNMTLQSANVGGGGGNLTSTFHIENPSHSFAHGVSVAVGSPAAPSDPGKKKRGRPRKYAPDGANMSLGLSPMSSMPSSGPITPTGPKKARGRPPGTGWKQQLSSLGEWMNTSAGLAFTPHVIHVGVGEDVSTKILSFAQQKPRALCILSANGSVSAVTLRQSVASGGTVTYEGRFEILCLSGSYLLAETGGPRNRTGGLSISVCSPDGHVIGGAIGGRLIAASPVQVVVCSFVWGGKAKNKTESSSKDEKNSTDLAEKSSAAISQDQNPNSATSSYPLGSRLDSRNFQTQIDLTRG